MPFTKVLEECKIYNFGIELLDHFCFKNLRKTLLNSVRLNWVSTLALQSARPRRRRASPRRGSAGPARRGRPWSVGPCVVEPPCRTAFPALSFCATHPRMTRRPPNHVAATPPPYLGHTVASLTLVRKKAPHRLAPDYKRSSPFFPRVTPSGCRPPWVSLGELPCSFDSSAVRALLAPLLAPLETARHLFSLATLPARRSPSSSGRRRVATTELASPFCPRAFQLY
jgi:hypothetical protein